MRPIQEFPRFLFSQCTKGRGDRTLKGGRGGGGKGGEMGITYLVEFDTSPSHTARSRVRKHKGKEEVK